MKLGFIDYFLDEWHANNYPERIRALSGGEITVAYAYAEIDAPHGLTTDAWCAAQGIRRCGSIAELVERSDGIVILSPDNCERHEALAQLPLASGKPCYIDKTFAPDKATAERIFARAEQFGTPCWSASSLRFAEEYQGFDPADVRAVCAWGPGPVSGGLGYVNYAVHVLEPVQLLMGCAPEAILAVSTPDVCYHLLLRYADGRTAAVTGVAGDCPYAVNILCGAGNRVVTAEKDFFQRFLAALVEFFRTGKVPVSHADTVAVMAAREAGAKALEAPGTWVTV